MIQVSALFPYYLDAGYSLDVITGKVGQAVLKHDPRIKLVRFPDNCVEIADVDLDEYTGFLEAEYDRAFTAFEIVETKFLKSYPQVDYYMPLGKLRKQCSNENYIEYAIKKAGFTPQPQWLNGKIYFSPDDIAWANNFRQEFRGKYIIVWALAGSSPHKAYRHYNRVARTILDAIPNSIIITVGSFHDMMLSFEHKRVINLGYRSESIMRAFALTKIANLVIGPETAVLNAAGCFGTPKICMLTHSSKTNLTKNWVNDFSLQAATYCSPCHLLQKVREIWKNRCPLEKDLWHQYGVPVPSCTGEGFPAGMMVSHILDVYKTTR